MNKAFVFSIFLLLFFMLTCANPGGDKECASSIEPINPNGDSELALLMREMFEEGMRIKKQVAKGVKPEVLKKFEAIHTAKATEPEKANSEAFKVFAEAHLATLEALKNAQPDEMYDLYQGMVQSCMNCHKRMCPGPMVKIKRLYLPAKE